MNARIWSTLAETGDYKMNWFDYIYNRHVFAKHGVQYAQFPKIWGRIMVSKFAEGGTIKIGRRVLINSSFKANPVGGHRTVFMIMHKNAVIELDDEAGISNVLLAAHERIYIGKCVAIGAGAKIMDTDFHGLRYADRVANTNTAHAPIIIRDRVFIGADTLILKGVTIGEDSIIGAGAVVAKSIPPGEIWGGNPARFLRKL